MRVKKLTLKEFKYIYSRVPRLCIEIVIRTSEGILLTKRSVGPLRGQWHIPGGTVLMGETIEWAVKRVAQEELGVKVCIKEMLGIIEYHIKNYFSQPIGLVFLIDITSNNQIKLDRQANDAKFFRVIPKNIVKEHKLFLKKLLTRRNKKRVVVQYE